ncbi:hypothetical protein RsTz2092_12670 [Deferribacterales bacterium RsTz2092]|nr:hypothetical protein AGMMS49941_06390 [Deferribacterales bacterium]
MGKRKFIVVCVALVSVVVTVVAVVVHRTGGDSATLTNIKTGHYRLACYDARWLLDENLAMLRQKTAQLGLDNATNNTNVANTRDVKDIKKAMDIVYRDKSEAQVALDSWYSELMSGVARFVGKDEQKMLAIQDSVGRDYVSIFYAAVYITQGVLDEKKAREGLTQEFCAM